MVPTDVNVSVVFVLRVGSGFAGETGAGGSMVRIGERLGCGAGLGVGVGLETGADWGGDIVGVVNVACGVPVLVIDSVLSLTADGSALLLMSGPDSHW